MQIPRLREWREARALTQVELAERAGVSERSVAGYEAGGGARPPTVRRLAEALGVEVLDLMGEAALPKGERRSSLEPSFNDVLAEERHIAPLRAWKVFLDDRVRAWRAEGEEFLQEEDPNDYGALAWAVSNRGTVDSIRDKVLWELAGVPQPAKDSAEDRELTAVCEAIDRATETAHEFMRQVVRDVHERAKATQAAAEESKIAEFQKAAERATLAREEIRQRTEELSA